MLVRPWRWSSVSCPPTLVAALVVCSRSWLTEASPTCLGSRSNRSRSSNEDLKGEAVEDDTLVVEPDQGNGTGHVRPGRRISRCRRANAVFRAVLMHIISQLRPGADLSRVVLPTFILEPRSMLERITKYAGP